MVDPDLLRRKTARVLHHIARLRERQDLSPADLLADEDRCNAVLMDMQQAIQGSSISEQQSGIALCAPVGSRSK